LQISFNMAELITIPTYVDERGSLSVLQDILPKPIERIFYVKAIPGQMRGGKVHKRAHQILVCLNGECSVEVINSKTKSTYTLNTSENGLLLSPGDWHQIYGFSKDNVLLVVSTEKYNPDEFSAEKPSTI
jgi:dTDP-4-dehydrorhamnose 3,5-epimerase-like enzyme